MYLPQFQEMKAHVSLCKCVNSPEPLLPAYTKYRCRPELRQLAPLRHMYCVLCDKYQNLTCWSNLHLSTLYISLNKISNYCFHLNAIIFILLLLSKNKSEIGFNIWYTISYTCVTHTTIIHCNISDIYDIVFIVKVI